MTACQTHRQVNAGRVPRYAPLSISGTREAARRVTTVALIFNAGILRQHTQGKVSRANRFRERSMQFEKQLSDGRSPFALARRRNKASRDSIHLTTEISALPASSEDDAPRRSTVAAASQLMVKTVSGFAACAEVAFPNFLLAVVSWIFAQALEGCAAYGEAMYPGLVGVGERAARHLSTEIRISFRAGHPVRAKYPRLQTTGSEGAGRFWYRVRLSPAPRLLLRPNPSSDRRGRAPLLLGGARPSLRFLRAFDRESAAGETAAWRLPNCGLSTIEG
jgi:hypothetical protein